MNIQGTLFRKPSLATSTTGKSAGLHGSNTYFQTKLSLPNRLETNTKNNVTLRFGQTMHDNAPISVNLQVLPLDLSVCRMDADAPFLPEWASMSEGFLNICRTAEELSIVAETAHCPDNITSEPGWAAIKVCGPLDFGLTGILESLAKPLAEKEISIFAVSTYDTDYVLVKKEKLEEAKKALSKAGHKFI